MTEQHRTRFEKLKKRIINIFGVNRENDTKNRTVNIESELRKIESEGLLPDWELNYNTDKIKNPEVGYQITFSKRISEEDVRLFALISGNTNPLALDGEIASQSRYGDQVVPSYLVGSIISAALIHLPFLTVPLAQDMEFHNPVRIGDQITAEVTIIEHFGDDQYRLDTQIYESDNMVIDGEAVVLLDKEPVS